MNEHRPVKHRARVLPVYQAPAEGGDDIAQLQHSPQLVPVSSCCSTSHATYVEANPVLYPAGLVPSAGAQTLPAEAVRLWAAEHVSE